MNGHIARKLKLAVLLVLLMSAVWDSVLADVGGICAEGVDNYNHSYSLTGDGTHDIVAVAQAQVGRTNSTFRYHSGGWCAAFINDCAYLAGQASVIPFIHNSTHAVGGLRDAVLNSGGYVVSTPQAGDLVFYWCTTDNYWVHVGLMENGSSTIQGNVNDMCKRLDSPWNYRDVNGACYNVSFVRPNYAPTTAMLDVNGYLDGFECGAMDDFGTCDVYINGSRVADDVNDYYGSWPIGTSYSIMDIKAKPSHDYKGVHKGALSGTIAAGDTRVYLSFLSYGQLNVNATLDGGAADTADGFGSFDVSIDGALVASNVTSYSARYSQGKAYEIRNVRAAEGYYFEGTSAGSLTGSFGPQVVNVTLAFSTITPPTGEWCETDALPGYIDPDVCEIQYRHTYTRTAESSPGEGWVQVAGSGRTTYVNSGDVQEYDFAQTTSDTLLYAGSYFYHYCGASMGNRVNFAYTGQYTDYHRAGYEQGFNVTGEWTDDDDPRYHSYRLVWAAGQPYTEGAAATCAAGRSNIWYRRYLYQPRKAMTNYTWTKTSDWETMKDESAHLVRYRYRLKDTALPIIESVRVTAVTPKGFALNCRASDDNSIAKIMFTSWIEGMEAETTRVQEIEPRASDGVWQADASITISDYGNYRDCYYLTRVQAYDTAGNVVEYSGHALRAYVPTLIRSTRILKLPAKLLEIQESAFEGDIGFGEVVLPEGVERIGARAFADCTRLMLITVPDSVQTIADDTFQGSANAVLLCSADSATAAFAQANGIPYLTALE